jgi:hypothetical protein
MGMQDGAAQGLSLRQVAPPAQLAALGLQQGSLKCALQISGVDLSPGGSATQVSSLLSVLIDSSKGSLESAESAVLQAADAPAPAAGRAARSAERLSPSAAHQSTSGTSLLARI